MSSFEPLRARRDDAGAFAPLLGGTRVPAERGAGAPFPDLHAPSPSPDEVAAEAATRERVAALAAEREQGRAEGRAAAERELSELVHGLGEAIRELARFRSGMLERYHGELLDLALEVARKVVDRELEAHPEHWLGMIRQGVQRALDRDRIRIRIAPALHGFLRAHLAELRAELDGVKELELIEDPALPATGCVVETSYGDLDLGVDSQITTIRAALTEPA
ncbi:MAG: FliH/SctL family protein [Thermodesulfobacteriota bacterium]